MAFRVVIIGGTGQVGAAVVQALAAEPSCAEVVMVTRRPMLHAGGRVRPVVLDTTSAAGSSASSHMRYPRVMGRKSDAVRAVGFTGLARALGMPRQRVLYHLRRLEAQRLVEAQDHGTVGRRIDRTYARTATSYAIAPKTLGGAAADPATIGDAFSSAYLSAVAGRALDDIAALGRAAAASRKRLPTITLETEVRFTTPADQRQFADELTAAFAALAAKFHRPNAPQGRTFRLFACGYPAVPARTTPQPSSADKETT